MGILDEIVAAKRAEVGVLRAHAGEIERAAAQMPAPRDFATALRRPDGRLAVIAELKRRSPSKGDLNPGLDPAATARAYQEGGAAALSVLTDHDYFGGGLADLHAARAACTLPVLRKDFTIDPVQVAEARAEGADAVLLIVAALGDAQLAELLDCAIHHGLPALVETHDADEVERALAAGARIVGINSRSLQTFAEDLSIAERLASALPADVIRIAESAVRSAEDAGRMAAAGFDAVLVGEALVRCADPRALCAGMAAHPVVRSAA